MLPAGLPSVFCRCSGTYPISSPNFQVFESESEVAQSCPTLCDPMDCSLPGFSVHGIFQARILERVTISFYRISSQPRDQSKEIEENNRMGKTRDLFKKIRDTKGTFHAKMGSIKDRNGNCFRCPKSIHIKWQT